MPPMSFIDWAGLLVPLVTFLLMLVAYYVWEGRRERRLRRQYGDAAGEGAGAPEGDRGR